MILLLNNQENLIKVVSKKAIHNAIQTQTLTDEHYVAEFLEVEMNELSEDVLNQVEYMCIQTKDNQYKYHMFFVNKHETDEGITTLFGTQSAIEELRKTPIKDQRPQDLEARIAISRVLEGTNWSAGYVADTGHGSTNFYYLSAFDSLKKICEVWGLEMQFFVEMNGREVGARYIDFKKQLGEKTGERVVYGHNALKVLAEVEKMDLVTALIGRGRALEVSSAEENESGQAGYGRKLTFADVEWRKANGNPVNKAKGLEYVEIPERTAQYGIKTPTGNRPKIGVIEIDTDDPNVLLQRTYDKLLELSRPKMTFKTSTAYLKRAAIGNTVRVVHSERKLDYETRVFEITWDRLTNEATDVKLGDRLNVSESARNAQIKLDVENSLVPGMVQLVSKSLLSANGKNTNWYTDFDPLTDNSTKGKVRVGDIWFKPDPTHEGETIIVTWTGETWKEIVRTHEWGEVKEGFQRIDEQVKTLDRAVKEIEPQLDETKEHIKRIDEQANASLKVIGNDKRMIYSDNRIQTEIDTSKDVVVTFEDGQLVLQHNGGGFTPGVEHTIWFTHEFVERPHSQLIVSNKNNVQMSVRAIATNERYPNSGLSGSASVTFKKLYNDTYAIHCSASGKQPLVITKRITNDTRIAVNFEDVASYINSSIHTNTNFRNITCTPIKHYSAITSITTEYSTRRGNT